MPVLIQQVADQSSCATGAVSAPVLAEWRAKLSRKVTLLREYSRREVIISVVSGWIQSSPEAWRCCYKLLIVLVALHLVLQTWWALPAQNPDATVTHWQTVRRLFVAKVALTSFMASVSLHTQIRGLVGTQGIIPFPTHAADRIRRHPPGQKLLSWEAFRRQPMRWIVKCINVLESRWWSRGCERASRADDDTKVTDLCWLGEVSFCAVFVLSLCEGCWGCSLLGLLAELLLGTLRVAFLLTGTFSYKLLRSCTGVFMGLQWDCLVIEECLLAVPLALPLLPNCWLPPLLLPGQLLLFKCMFGSGVVKRRSRCPRWANSTAMDLHYETQPIPHLVSWYMHKLPHAWHAHECWIAFLVQLPLTFFQWCIWPCRLLAFLGYVALMFTIQGTGNYGFFNVQVGGLAISFLDDSLLPFSLFPQCTPFPTWSVLVLLPVVAMAGLCLSAACAYGLLQLPRLSSIFNPPKGSIAEWALSSWQKTYEALSPLGIGHSYGPFAGMTTFRWELIFEHSSDCLSWTQLEFPYKPGCINTPPRWMPIGHFQRLDWRLWFVPLSMGRGRWGLPDWVEGFVEKLLKGSPTVAALTTAKDDIVNSPPGFIRVSVWDYHFSSCDSTAHQCSQVTITRAEHESAYTKCSWWQAPCVNMQLDAPLKDGDDNCGNCGSTDYALKPDGHTPVEWGRWWYRRFVARCGVYYLHDGQLRVWTEAMCTERPRKVEETTRLREELQFRREDAHKGNAELEWRSQELKKRLLGSDLGTRGIDPGGKNA